MLNTDRPAEAGPYRQGADALGAAPDTNAPWLLDSHGFLLAPDVEHVV